MNLTRNFLNGIAKGCATAVLAILSHAAIAASAHYFDGGIQRDITLDPQFIAVINAAPTTSTLGSSSRSATSPTPAPLVVIQPASQPLVRSVGTTTSPVYREGNSPAGRLMALPGGVLIKLDPELTDSQVRAWASGKGLSIKQRLNISGNWYVVDSAPGAASLDLANALQQSGEVLAATPNWWKQTAGR